MGCGDFDHHDRQQEREEQETPEPPLFQPFEKIARLKRDIVITEKIDGTNAQLYIDPENLDKIWVGSRKRWITPGKGNDNSGFAGWVDENYEELLTLGAGHHYGEWWGQSIQRRYNLDHKRFSLFNVHRWDDEHNRTWMGQRAPKPDCCHVVPVLYKGPMTDIWINETLEALDKNGSRAAPGFMDAEGIVVFHEALRKLFKVTIKNDDKPKGQVEAEKNRG